MKNINKKRQIKKSISTDFQIAEKLVRKLQKDKVLEQYYTFGIPA